jgi:hypothetical protein
MSQELKQDLDYELSLAGIIRRFEKNDYKMGLMRIKMQLDQGMAEHDIELDHFKRMLTCSYPWQETAETRLPDYILELLKK